MRGWIRKRGKYFQVGHDLGPDPTTGTRRRRTKNVRGSKRDAQRELTRMLREADTGTAMHPDQASIADLLQTWLATDVQDQVAPSSARQYRQRVERICRHIGHVRVQALRPEDVAHLYATLRADGLSPRTIAADATVLKRALSRAVAYRIIAANPAELVRPPRPAGREMRTLSVDEIGTLLAAAEEPEMRTLIAVAVHTGLRVGELCGPRWSDVAGTKLHVQRNASYVPGGDVELRSPKTRSSRRQLSLAEETVGLLRDHRVRQLEHRLAVAAVWNDNDLAFPDAMGRPQAPGTVSKRFGSVVRAAGLDRVTFHTLRHTSASLALAANVNPKVVAERLGHASVGITLDLYSHTTPDLQQDAADRIAAAAAATRR